MLRIWVAYHQLVERPYFVVFEAISTKLSRSVLEPGDGEFNRVVEPGSRFDGRPNWEYI